MEKEIMINNNNEQFLDLIYGTSFGKIQMKNFGYLSIIQKCYQTDT
jgi:hypothetical protein